MIKVMWLAPYPASLLEPELTLRRPQKSHPSSWIVSLSNELAKRKEIVLHIMTGSAGIRQTQTFEKNGIVFHVVRHTFPFSVRGYPQYLRLDALTRYSLLRRRAGSIIREVNPDLIHVHGTESWFGLPALSSKIPTVISIQGIISLIREVENSVFFSLQAPIERMVIRKASFFGSRTKVADEYIRSINSTATILYMPEAVNPVFFKLEPRKETHCVLMIGSVQQRKGIEVAVEAMGLVVKAEPTACLQVVGGGDPRYLDNLKRRSAELNVSRNVMWLGHRTPEEIAELHTQCRMLIQPTLVDNSPNTIAEAMVSGLPVIASNVGGIPSMIQDGETGLLVEPNSPELLAEKILLLLTNGPQRSRLSTNAREVAVQRHHPSLVAQRTLAAYDDILRQRVGVAAPRPTLSDKN